MSVSFRRRVRELRFLLVSSPLLVVAVGLLLTGALFAAPDAAGEKPADASKADETETEIQHAARKLVEGIKLNVIAGEKPQQLQLVQQPVLRYGDIPRANDKGSVWIWHQSGRPQAIMELYRSVDSRSWV